MPQEDPFQACGGYMNVKISKLENQVANSKNIYKQSNLFEGISIFVNGWTNPTADDLKRIMMTYGGTYHHYERKHTTFIIAENLPDVKIRNMNTSNVVKPKWIVDCIKANKILDYSKYLLYTNQKRSQPSLFFKNSSDESTFLITEKHKQKNKKFKRNLSMGHDDEEDEEDDESPEVNSNIKMDSVFHSSTSLKRPFQEDYNKVGNGQNEPKKFYQDPDIALEILNNQIASNPQIIPKKNNLSEKSPVKGETISTKARTANDPKFLSEFYNNSRLHHIATLGAGFKQYVTELRENHSGEFPLRKELLKTLCKKPDFVKNSYVMHIDMDCFFVSVGLRTHPHLKGHPVAVTHSKGGAEVVDRPGVDREKELNLYMNRLENRFLENVMDDKKEKIKTGFEGKESLSEIASCSYEARKKGVKNGMFVGQALKLCPGLKTIPYDFEGYKEVAFKLYDTIAQYTLDIEAVSCDEMFVDLTNLLNDIQVDVMDFVTYVREEVKSKTQCPCSAGVGGNRLQARMATKKAKPDGQFYLDPNTVLEYMTDISIKSLPGVGYSTELALKQLNWTTCGDLQSVPLSKLQMEFGKKFGETLYQSCRGMDSRPLVFGQIRKSVSAEVNYGIRFTENLELEKFLRQLCEEVHSRLTKINRKGKCITLKVMVRAKEAPTETAKFMGHGFCDSMNKSVSLSDYTSDLETITRTVLTTMKALNLPPKELRGLGIQISKLDDPNEAKKANIIKNMFNKVLEKQKVSYNESLQKTPEKQKIIHNEIKDTNIRNQSPHKNLHNVATKLNITPEKAFAGRGKLPKSKTNSNAKPNTTILSMFQNAAKNPKPPKIAQKLYSATEIDRSVLAELPEDIQREILRENRITIENFPSPSKNYEHSISSNKNEQNKNEVANSEPENFSVENKTQIEVDIEFLNALPQNLRDELEKEIAEAKDKYIIVNKKESNEKIARSSEMSSGHFMEIEPNQNDLDEAGPSKNTFDLTPETLQDNPIKYIKNWVNSTNKPIRSEIENFCNNVKACVKLGSNAITAEEIISELYKIINQSDNCQWHIAFDLILKILQEEILAFKSNLNYEIECDDCS